MFILYHENKNLLETIKMLLQVFPESVIIQSYDKETKTNQLKFVNNAAKQYIFNNNIEDNPKMDIKDIDLQVRIKYSNNELNDSDKNIDYLETTQFSSLIKKEYEKILEDGKEHISQMEIIKDSNKINQQLN
jgi:hypothetical protein